MKFLKRLEAQKSTWYLIALCFLFFLLRLPSLFEPLWYGDEGIYEVIGTALHQGRLLYSGIWDNKPPLLYYIYALFNGDQSSVRLFSLIFGVASIIVFFYVSKKLFQNQRISYITTTAFALLFATPLLEGNIANAENFMLLPIGLSALLILSVKREALSVAGFLLGIAFLTKVVAVFDFAAFFIFLFIINFKNIKSIPNQIGPFLYFFTGFIIPIVLACLFFILQGNFGDFIQSAFIQNVGYVAYKNAYIIPQGLLMIKLIFLIGFLCFLFFTGSRLPQTHMLILIWLAFSVFNAFFSQRPYTHYLLVLLMSSCLFAGIILTANPFRTRMIYSISGILLLVFLIKNFSSGNSTKAFLYYGNFISFLFQQKTTDAYLGFFDKATPRDYEVAAYINGHKHPYDSIFVWGNNPQLYKLTNTLPPGRFLAEYHIIQSQETIRETYNSLQKNVPRYIIVLPIQQKIPYSLIWYRKRYYIDDVIVYEKNF